MKIVLFHPTRLPPKDYGGVERVVLWLARGLVERGHEVHVAAARDSRLPSGVRLIAIDDPDPRKLPPRLPSGCEIVHFMAPPGDAALKAIGCGSLVTIHGNGRMGEVFPRNSVFVSRDHARRHSAEAFVWNGIDPGELQGDSSHERAEFLFLSRTAWKVKNVKGAARMCALAQVRLGIAGGWRPFGLCLETLSRLRRRTRWLGPVGGSRKAELLASASALIFPILWDEPFGLVVVEAWMSGTPVLASRRGSLPELFEGGSAALGRLLPDPEQDLEAWVRVLQEYAAAPQEAEVASQCRAHALERFHYSKMAQSYETHYRTIASGAYLHASSPRTMVGVKS